MAIGIKIQDKCYIITPLSKRLSLSDCDELKVLIHNLTLDHITSFVINFENIHYIDSSGLGCIVFITRTISLSAGKVIFCHLSSNVIKILTQTKTDKIIHIASTVDDAIVALMNGKNGY